MTGKYDIVLLAKGGIHSLEQNDIQPSQRWYFTTAEENTGIFALQMKNTGIFTLWMKNTGIFAYGIFALPMKILTLSRQRV